MNINRRQFLRAGAAGGALLVVPPLSSGSALAATGRSAAQEMTPLDAYGTSRQSRLFAGAVLAHADLHNHTTVSANMPSDTPPEALASMREAGLDIAALTDHSYDAKTVPDSQSTSPPDLDERDWQEIKKAADEAYQEGRFVAIRGFEWTSPANAAGLGHLCVFDGKDWTDPVALGAVGGGTPADADMRKFYDWLRQTGSDSISQWNHPGELAPQRFGQFTYVPAVDAQMVGIEVFNGKNDHLFRGLEQGQSPIGQCLDAGWHPGMVGVTDWHGKDHGFQPGLGRAGLYVDGLTRADVTAARRARRSFATRLTGLRIDVAAAPGRRAAAYRNAGRRDGFSGPQAPRGAVRMGQTLRHRRGPVTFFLDIDKGREWYGRPLSVQVLQSGTPVPRVIAEQRFAVPRPTEPVPIIEAEVDARQGDWVMVRVSDPAQPADPRATPPYTTLGDAVAYASPIWLG